MQASHELPEQARTKVLYTQGDLDDFASELEQVSNGLPQRINANPEDVERGLSQLVLTLIELLRQLMERQALRRIEAGSLSDDEIEQLGQTFLKLEEKMQQLKQTFDLTDEDLNINLGPLGNLL
ncbi:MAG: gas vesicle protein K [Chloroflexales bacterium]|nr:gas vesicle protein K [Chloroflexales bacterium]